MYIHFQFVTVLKIRQLFGINQRNKIYNTIKNGLFDYVNQMNTLNYVYNVVPSRDSLHTTIRCWKSIESKIITVKRTWLTKKFQAQFDGFSLSYRFSSPFFLPLWKHWKTSIFNKINKQKFAFMLLFQWKDEKQQNNRLSTSHYIVLFNFLTQ